MFSNVLSPCSPAKGLPARGITKSVSSDDDSLSDDDHYPFQTNKRTTAGSSISSPTLSPAFGIKANQTQNLLEHASDTASTIRIIAPNVSKLSRSSIIDVKLNSINECVVVTCSVDVLKMRSGFFHDILREREENFVLGKGKNADVVREPISIPEISPYEAAAYLESLHEGRALFKGEWNMCWARLR